MKTDIAKTAEERARAIWQVYFPEPGSDEEIVFVITDALKAHAAEARREGWNAAIKKAASLAETETAHAEILELGERDHE